MPKKTFYNIPAEKRNRIIEAAIDEFSQRSYDSANLANIIKNSKIPRGSFYQYFVDKRDLFMHLFELTRKKKMDYLNETLMNPENVPFLVLFKNLYKAGIMFAKENEKLVRIMSFLVSTKGPLYEEIFKENLEVAKTIYYDLIEIDKSRGLIRPEIDSSVFATIVRDMTVNISLDEFDFESIDFNYDRILERVTQVIKIFEIGVKQGDYNV